MQILSNNHKMSILSNSLYEANIVLIPKPEKGNMRKEIYGLILYIIIDEKF